MTLHSMSKKDYKVLEYCETTRGKQSTHLKNAKNAEKNFTQRSRTYLYFKEKVLTNTKEEISFHLFNYLNFIFQFYFRCHRLSTNMLMKMEQ